MAGANGNGHHNGDGSSNGYSSQGYNGGNGTPPHTPSNGQLKAGGLGGLPIVGTTRPRSDVRNLVRAAVEGWLKPQDFGWVVDTLRDVAATARDPRARVHAAEGLIRIADLGLKWSEFEDKTGRLDGGEATERVVFDVTIPEARSRL